MGAIIGAIIQAANAPTVPSGAVPTTAAAPAATGGVSQTVILGAIGLGVAVLALVILAFSVGNK